MGVNMKDGELVKMFNLTLKMRETIIFFLIVGINTGLIWIDSDIRLDTCAMGRWREVSKMEMSQPLGSSYLIVYSK